MPTNATVKRYRIIGIMNLGTIEPLDGEFVLASDYDKLNDKVKRGIELYRREKRIWYAKFHKQQSDYDKLEAACRELVECCMHCELAALSGLSPRCDLCVKALSIIGEKQGEG